MTEQELCAWCSQGITNNCKVSDDCSLKDLPYEKEAILKRVEKEGQYVKEHIDKLSEMEQKEAMDIVDRIQGIKLMSDEAALLGATDKELKDAMPDFSMMERSKAAYKLMKMRKEMKKKRGKKK